MLSAAFVAMVLGAGPYTVTNRVYVVVNRCPLPVVIPASTIDAAVALHQAAKAAPVAAPVMAPLVESPCPNGNCSTQRRGLFGRRR